MIPGLWDEREDCKINRGVNAEHLLINSWALDVKRWRCQLLCPYLLPSLGAEQR